MWPEKNGTVGAAVGKVEMLGPVLDVFGVGPWSKKEGFKVG